MIATDLRPGDVLRYRPLGEFEPHWCREGLALVDDNGHAFDTYWGTYGDHHRLTEAELASADLVFNVNDYDELDQYSRGSRLTWETYHPDDRARITQQHGHQERLFIRLGAEPSLETQIENARAEVEQAETDLASSERRLQWRREDLAKLEAQRV